MNYENKSNSAVLKFLKKEKGQSALCKYTDCKMIFKTKGGSTKGLHTHLLQSIKLT